LRVYRTWQCHATYQQIVTSSLTWTLTLCISDCKNLGCCWKMLILAIDKSWKSAGEIIYLRYIYMLKWERRTHSHNLWLLLVLVLDARIIHQNSRYCTISLRVVSDDLILLKSFDWETYLWKKYYYFTQSAFGAVLQHSRLSLEMSQTSKESQIGKRRNFSTYN